MREIKFKGYEPLFKKWAYGHYHPSEGYQVIFDIERSTPSRPYPAIVMHESIGQYTGLKDKNGVEIYEGDVVKVSDSKEKFRNIIEQIKFSRGSFNLDGTELWHLEDDYNSGKIFYEVIGNIYENPELLEGTE